MVDANGDGFDDQTGAPVGTNAVGGYVPPDFGSGGGAATSGPLPPQVVEGAATNLMNSYQTDNAWEHVKIKVGALPVRVPSTSAVGTGSRGMSHASYGPGDAGVSRGKGHVIPQPLKLSPFELLQDFDGWTRKQYLGFRNKLIAAGLAKPTDTAADVKDAYAKLLQQVVYQQSRDANMATPMDIIDNYIRLNGLDPNKIGSSADPSASLAKDTTYTQKSVYDLNPAQARQTLEQALQQELGRAPTHAEIEDFISAVQTHAASDPTTVTTHYHTDAEGNTVASQNTHSGFGAENVANMAEGVGKHSPDYKSYQAVSTYFPALQQALGATI